MTPARLLTIGVAAGFVGLAAAVAVPAAANPSRPAGPVAVQGRHVQASATTVRDGRAAAPRRVRGVPQGAPRAARQPEPTLPAPSHRAWPFPSSFPRTSGTGRLAGGASLWSDYLFDDHGAAAPAGLPLATTSIVSTLAPTQGVAGYPAGAAKGNGADIFRAGVGLTRRASYWRVDWTTLINPRVPIAEWTFDTDNNPKTGVSTWPAAAGVHSAGINEALVVSATDAELINATTGSAIDIAQHGGLLIVDRKLRSFIVRIPRTLLPVNGQWRVRLASGLASSDGRSFAPADYAAGGDALSAASLPRVYNVTFRTVRQEPPVYTDGSTDARVAQLQKLLASLPPDTALGLDGALRAVTGNFWMEDHQADALATGGNVAPFSRLVAWSSLTRHITTPQPQPRGYSNRWYVSRLRLGQGVIANGGSPTGDLLPNYLSRVQPYAVYVPRHVNLTKPVKLTWILHSLGVNLNQYGALDPKLVRAECQQRHSICATTEGFGPDLWYFDDGEQDFWSVWHALATSYDLDTRHTVISGYSMGGWASYKLGLEHPDLFSEAMPLEGPPDCGIRLLELPGGEQITASAGDGITGRCAHDGSSTPLLGNARWLPYVVTQGAADELVPAPSNLQTTGDMARLGDRYTLFFLPAEDHLVYALQDRFAGVVKALGKTPAVVRNPGRIAYAWYPNLDDRKLGIGTTTAYWLSGLRATTNAPGVVASLHAHSFGIADRKITTVTHGAALVTTPLAALRSSLTWRLGARPATSDRLSLTVSRVRAVAANLARAHLACPAVTTTSTNRVQLTLSHLVPGSHATIGRRRATASRRGRLTIRLPKGRSTLHLICGARP